MNPLPDRVVVVVLLTTIGLCFALVLWTVRLNPRLEPPLQWRDAPSAERPGWPSGAADRLL
ncbi:MULTISPECIES: hypothetical protein [Aphanothece]|uniref:hypothetical protein n=1 Tax=Aphanothece TaxID=1121 RepID=UPI00398567CF